MRSSKSINAEFLAAAKNNNLEKVKELTKHPDLDINCVDEFGNTALHIFAQIGSEPGVEFLLQNRIDTRVKNRIGETASSIAQQFHRMEIAKAITRKAITRSSNLPYPNRKNYVIIGDDVDYRGIEQFVARANASVIFINSEKSFNDEMERLRNDINIEVGKDPDTEVRIIVSTHGNEKAIISISDKYDINRNLMLKKLFSPQNNKMLVEFFHCRAGAGLMRTDKSVKLPTASPERAADYERGNFNQEDLYKILPPNAQVSFDAGRFDSMIDVGNAIINQLLSSYNASTFTWHSLKAIFPQTFKFVENIDDQIFEYKCNAPKLEDLQKVDPKELTQYYRRYIANNVREIKAQYLANHPQLLPCEIAEIAWEERNIISSINDPSNQVVEQYINTDLLISAGEGKLDRVQFYLGNIDNFSIKINLDYQIARDHKDVMTPLLAAYSCGHIEIAKALVKAGADVDKFFAQCTANGKSEGEIFKIASELGINSKYEAVPSSAPSSAQSALSDQWFNLGR